VSGVRVLERKWIDTSLLPDGIRAPDKSRQEVR
jgi:hypothetical protein